MGRPLAGSAYHRPTFFEAARRSAWVRAGAAVLALGWVPLILYVIFDALTGGGGNPIGLGLLMVCATPVAVALLAVGAFKAYGASRGAA